MSPLKMTLAMTMGVLGIGCGAALGGHSARTLASITPAKSASFRPVASQISKPNQAVNVRIVQVGDFPENGHQELRLKAIINAPLALDGDLSLQWTLPENVQLVSGSLNQVVPGLQPGQPYWVEIVVTGFSSDQTKRNISLDVSGSAQANAVGNVAIFSNHPTRADLSLGFRKSRVLKNSQNSQAKTESTDDSQDSEPQIPKGLHL